MKFIADLHIHSHYSMATSKQLIPEQLDYWAKIKGIGLVGTGDFTHPKWLAELQEKLIPAEQGLYRLKPELILKNVVSTNLSHNSTRFVLSAEISSIYKKNGKVRKIHNILLSPSFEIAQKVQHKLQQQQFNITSDGRPIIGLDAKHLLEMMLDISEEIFFIPAHIWTPWFSLLGEKSGFDSIEECFEDLSKYIYAIETGLSSDAPLNYLCSILDNVVLLSNSDAHSPDKLGRNANVFDTEMTYNNIINAIKTKNKKEFLGTIDMFPQEGKYHYDGHRDCNICWNPLETLQHKYICPVCQKKITVGVTHRIALLCDRSDITQHPNPFPFQYIIPLENLIEEIYGIKSTSKKAKQLYMDWIKWAGSEFNLLLDVPIEDFENSVLATAIARMRKRQVMVSEGYDGEYGVVKVFGEGELVRNKNGNIFLDAKSNKEPVVRKLLNFDLAEFYKLKQQITESLAMVDKGKKPETKQLGLF